MGRKGVTQTDVATAYDALDRAGIYPSIRAIRERLGHTGSFKTIAEHVRTLKSSRDLHPDRRLAHLPGETVKLPASIRSERFWQALIDSVDTLGSEQAREARESLAAMEQEREDTLREMAALQTTTDALQQQVRRLQSQLSERDAQLSLIKAMVIGELDELSQDCLV